MLCLLCCPSAVGSPPAADHGNGRSPAATSPSHEGSAALGSGAGSGRSSLRQHLGHDHQAPTTPERLGPTAASMHTPPAPAGDNLVDMNGRPLTSAFAAGNLLSSFGDPGAGPSIGGGLLAGGGGSAPLGDIGLSLFPSGGLEGPRGLGSAASSGLLRAASGPGPQGRRPLRAAHGVTCTAGRCACRYGVGPLCMIPALLSETAYVAACNAVDQSAVPPICLPMPAGSCTPLDRLNDLLSLVGGWLGGCVGGPQGKWATS